MKYKVVIEQRMPIESVRTVELEIEASNGEGAKAIAEATAKYNSEHMAWTEAKHVVSPLDDIGAVYTVNSCTPTEPPKVTHTEEYGWSAACGLCHVNQNGLPASGPWRCKSCGQVNQRSRS